MSLTLFCKFSFYSELIITYQFRATYNSSTGALIGNRYQSGSGHSHFTDMMLHGTTLYMLSVYDSVEGIMLMSFDTSTNTAGQSYTISSSHGSFIEGNNTGDL